LALPYPFNPDTSKEVRMRRAHVCSIIPPHIQRHIAEHGDEEQRRRAQLNLETSSHTRGHRAALLGIGLAVVSPGEKRRTVYDAQEKKALPGKLIRGEGSKSNGDLAAEEAYEGSGKTFDFYAKVFDRNSIDGRGMRIDSSVHYAKEFDNAQWNGRQMLYGDGDSKLFNRFTKALDVIGHELTHGVTQYSAALDYHDQPGALNEHFSDVFGILMKQYTLKQSAVKSNWLIGEGIFTKQVHGVAVRSLKAPGTAFNDPVIGKDPQPAHMSKFNHGHADNGGVHINSGIPNHAFYKVAIALGGNAWEVAGRIWYVTLTQKLQHDSTFIHCADATFTVAGEIFGRASEPQKAVRAAWKAVGIEISEKVAAGEPKLMIRKQPVFEPAIAGAEVPLDEPRVDPSPRRKKGAGVSPA
jgi:Zn-dependent metalloprotease